MRDPDKLSNILGLSAFSYNSTHFFTNRKNVLYFKSFVLEIFKFRILKSSISWRHQIPKHETINTFLLNNLGSKHTPYPHQVYYKRVLLKQVLIKLTVIQIPFTLTKIMLNNKDIPSEAHFLRIYCI